MPIDRLVHLEAGIQEPHGLHPQRNEALLWLISELQQEIANVSNTYKVHAQSIARVTDISAHEATRRHKNQDLLRIAMEACLHRSQSLKPLINGSHDESMRQ